MALRERVSRRLFHFFQISMECDKKKFVNGQGGLKSLRCVFFFTLVLSEASIKCETARATAGHNSACSNTLVHIVPLHTLALLWRRKKLYTFFFYMKQQNNLFLHSKLYKCKRTLTVKISGLISPAKEPPTGA